MMDRPREIRTSAIRWKDTPGFTVRMDAFELLNRKFEKSSKALKFTGRGEAACNLRTGIEPYGVYMFIIWADPNWHRHHASLPSSSTALRAASDPFAGASSRRSQFKKKSVQ